VDSRHLEDRGESIRNSGASSAENAFVAVERGETTYGPVAVDGRTLTLVARTHRWRGRHVWTRPTHLEVLDEDGKREVVRIRDTEYALIGAAAAALTAVVVWHATRAVRR